MFFNLEILNGISEKHQLLRYLSRLFLWRVNGINLMQGQIFLNAVS